MTNSDRFAGHRLLETGTLVGFTIVKQSIEAGPDDAEFAVRLDLVFNSEDDEAIEAEDIAEWGAFGFMFALGVLSFADGRPRDSSADTLSCREALLFSASRSNSARNCTSVTS